MIEKNNIPKHIGIIIDGNRRWARERNLPTIDGHKYGYKKVLLAPEWFFMRGVKTVSVYVFSTENWNRSSQEVAYLMQLLSKAFRDDIDIINKKEYKVVVSGWTDDPRIPGDLPDILSEVEVKTRDNTRGVLNICFNYGGWTEITQAVKKVLDKGIETEQVHEGLIRKYMYHAELGDLDILMRTGGEKRLSGFMPMQATYAELFFLEKFWPDFEEVDAENILIEFRNRERRMGGDGPLAGKS
jgi:undecaprenyl diphosphate synthase